MKYKLLSLKEPLELDNPNDVDCLYKWARQAEKEIKFWRNRYLSSQKNYKLSSEWTIDALCKIGDKIRFLRDAADQKE
jgi:hypothetical protein